MRSTAALNIIIKDYPDCMNINLRLVLGGIMGIFKAGVESPALAGAPLFFWDCLSAPIVAMLAILLTHKLVRSLWDGKESGRFPPGPSAWPVIGHLHLLTSLSHRAFSKFSQKYGPIVGLRLGQQLAVAISSPELAKEVLHTHDKVFANRPPFHFNDLLLGGQNSDIVFSAQCPQWRKQRKICTVGLFTAKRLQELEYVRQEEVSSLLARVQEESAGATQAVDIGHCVNEMTCQLIMRLLQSEGTMLAGGENLVELVREMELQVSVPMMRDLIPALSCLDFLRKRRMRRLHARMQTAFTAVLARRKQSTLNSSHHYNDLLQSLLSKEVQVDIDGTFSAADQETLTPNEIKGILLDMMGGGIHTTSLTLEWAMAELLKNPHCLEKLRREIDDVVFDSAGKRRIKNNISDADVAKLSYLKCVMKETARLHPVLPMLLPRFSTAECKIKGYSIPARTIVFVNVWAIGRDEQAWPNAGEFRPERFDEQEVDLRGQHYELLPFGSGRRICPAVQLALSVVELTLANLVHRFDWQLPPGVTPASLNMQEKDGISNKKATPTLAIPKPRLFTD
ncbi:hypothetical protein L7F22_020864 [Adiantum nelumboides]|nr:hypothetical protein [Adiantum nelumboides]